MVGLSEAYLAELRERMHAVTHPQDDERAQNVIDALDQVRACAEKFAHDELNSGCSRR
jgi:hypothetical protein